MKAVLIQTHDTIIIMAQLTKVTSKLITKYGKSSLRKKGSILKTQRITLPRDFGLLKTEELTTGNFQATVKGGKLKHLSIGRMDIYF